MILLALVIAIIFVSAFLRLLWLKRAIRLRLEAFHPEIWQRLLGAGRTPLGFSLALSKSSAEELRYIGDAEIQALLDSGYTAAVVYSICFFALVIVLVLHSFLVA